MKAEGKEREEQKLKVGMMGSLTLGSSSFIFSYSGLSD